MDVNDVYPGIARAGPGLYTPMLLGMPLETGAGETGFRDRLSTC